jgi:hypothetical protein
VNCHVYNPQLSFLARCWWQLQERIEPEHWLDATPHLAPLWVEFDSDGRWDRYLRAEPEGQKEKHLSPEDYRRRGHTYCELFWFGAYSQGLPHPRTKFRYEIRPYDRVWMPWNWVLDFNDHAWSGYLGFKRPEQPAGSDRGSLGTQLWTLEGLDARNLRKGAVHCNLELVTSTGRLVRRYKTDGVGAMNMLSGQRSLVTLEILSAPHAAFRP